MNYSINQYCRRNNKYVVLDTGNFKTYDAASAWFTDYIADMLSNDDSGRYRYESFLESEDGRFYNESSCEVTDALPCWWKGKGFYDNHNHMVLEYVFPRDGSFEDINMFDTNDYVYRLEYV